MGIPAKGLKMKGAFVILLAVIVASISMASALPADNNPVMDCTKVAGELEKVIKDCSAANPDDTTAILECVEEVFEMTADWLNVFARLLLPLREWTLLLARFSYQVLQ